VTIHLFGRPSAAWAARELGAGHAFETRADSCHNPRQYRDAIGCETRPAKETP
jgi:hypothetical protein